VSFEWSCGGTLRSLSDSVSPKFVPAWCRESQSRLLLLLLLTTWVEEVRVQSRVDVKVYSEGERQADVTVVRWEFGHSRTPAEVVDRRWGAAVEHDRISSAEEEVVGHLWCDWRVN
jgi:hypothetical protein